MVGESFETSPENIDNPASDNSAEVGQGTENQTREVEPQKLKAIYEKCTKKPDDKDGRSLRLGVDLVLEEEEIKELKTLEDAAGKQLADLTRDNPLWHEFIAFEKEGVDKDILQGIGKYGTTEKDFHVAIIESSEATVVTKALHESGRAAIKVPSEIASLVRQRNRLDDLKRVHSISREDVSSNNFGSNLKETYRFYKEHTDTVDSEASAVKGEVAETGSSTEHTEQENTDIPSNDGSTEEERGVENKNPELNVEKLKDIFEKCTKDPGDDHHEPVFGRHVNLSEDEVAEVQNLRELSRKQLEELTQNEPLWNKYIALEEEGKGKHIFGGFTAKIDYLVEDTNAIDVSKTITENGSKGIKVPTKIAEMVDQRQRIQDLEWGLKQVHGTGARDFGDKMKEVYRFYKEHTDNIDSRASVMKGEIVGEGSNATAHAVKEDQNKDVLKRFTLSKEGFAVDRVEAIKNTMEEIKSAHPEVLSMTLFGSMVRGDAREASDIDGYLFIDAENLVGQYYLSGRAKLTPDIQTKYETMARESLKEKAGLSDEQVKHVRALPMSQEIIEAEITRLLPSANAMVEYNKWRQEVEKEGKDIYDLPEDQYKRYPEYKETAGTSLNVYSMFHLAVGRGIEKYRKYLIDRLKDHGEEGELIWKEIIQHTESLENRLQNETGKKYPQTLQEAQRTYGGN